MQNGDQSGALTGASEPVLSDPRGQVRLATSLATRLALSGADVNADVQGQLPHSDFEVTCIDVEQPQHVGAIWVWSLPDTARRIVATWNACIGIATETLESMASGHAVNSLLVFQRISKENDELRNLLTDAHDYITQYEDVLDGDDGPKPNRAMSLAQDIREVLDKPNTARPTRDALAGIIRKAQGILARYIVPDSGISDHDVIGELLGLLDGPETRAVLPNEPNKKESTK
jgi:hypothetical protein